MNRGYINITREIFETRDNALYLLFQEVTIIEMAYSFELGSYRALCASNEWFRSLQEGEAVPTYVVSLSKTEKIESIDEAGK